MVTVVIAVLVEDCEVTRKESLDTLGVMATSCSVPVDPAHQTVRPMQGEEVVPHHRLPSTQHHA